MSAPLVVRCGAEFAGTATLVAVGTGAIVAASNLGGVPQWELAIAWFLAVLIPVLAFARLSGSHINPAVTLMLAASGRFEVREVVPYAAAQLSGALLGTLLVRSALGSGADLGAAVPHGIGLPEVFWLEFSFTFLLLLSVLVLTRAGGPVGRWELSLPAAIVGVSTECIGPLTGSSLNPARSLAPALVSGAAAGLGVYLGAAVAAAALAAVLAQAWKRRPSSDRRTALPSGRAPGVP